MFKVKGNDCSIFAHLNIVKMYNDVCHGFESPFLT